MYSFIYPAKVRRDESRRYVVTFPDLPRCATDGETLKEALGEAADAVEEAIANRITEGLDVPAPSKLRRGYHPIVLSGQMSAKAALYLALREAGISKSELARRLGVNEAEVRRMLDPRHNTRLPRMEEALAVLGKRLVVGMDAA